MLGVFQGDPQLPLEQPTSGMSRLSLAVGGGGAQPRRSTARPMEHSGNSKYLQFGCCYGAWVKLP